MMMNHKLLRFILFGSILITLVSWWDHEYVKYIKHFVVFIHEISHAVAALLSGGVVEKISIYANEAGETFIFSSNNAGAYPLIISAGYLGPSIIGAVLMNRGFLGRNHKTLIFSFGLLVLFFSFKYTVRGDLAYSTGIGAGILMLIISLISEKISRAGLIFMGAAISLYSVYDLFDFTKNVNHTDAGILASWILGKGSSEESLTSTGYIIALFWSMINLGIIYIAVIKTFHIDENHQLPDTVPVDVFPGEITPEVAEWFYKRGLDLNGNPLPLDKIEELNLNQKGNNDV